jgi:hypothetical protein
MLTTALCYLLSSFVCLGRRTFFEEGNTTKATISSVDRYLHHGLMDSLAQELIDIDAIAEEVKAMDQDNPWVRVIRSLQSCTLVATGFRATSRRRLFHSAIFGLGSRNKALKGLIRPSHLAAYVRDLQISLGDGVGNNYDLFTAAFALFIGVQRFVISATGKWDQNAPPHFRVALFSLVSFATLRCSAFHCPFAPSTLIHPALVSCEVVALDPFDESAAMLQMLHARSMPESHGPEGTRRQTGSPCPQILADEVCPSPRFHARCGCRAASDKHALSTAHRTNTRLSRWVREIRVEILALHATSRDRLWK